MANVEGVKKDKLKKGQKAVEKKANKLEKLLIEYVDIGSIKPNSYNPNRQSAHDFELLKRSMGEDGFTQPIIVQEGTNTIVDGEHRWRCAADLGYTQVPIVRVPMTPEQMKIATLRHNRARGSEDMELVGQVMRDLRELGALDWAADSLMLDDVEIQKLIEDTSAPDGLAGDDFNQGWAPTEDVKEEHNNPDAKLNAASTTKEAADALRLRETAIANAKTQEEKETVQRDMNVYRVALVYTQDQAVLVKEMLGEKPAEAVLKLCAEEKSRRAASAAS